MSTETEGTIRTLAMRDGAELHYRHWPTSSPRGVVVVLHGIQSHSGWYAGSCAHMARAGYEVVALDRRGSGLNKFGRGDVASFEVLVDDLRDHVDDIRRRLGDVPVHAQAISWGGRLACAALMQHPKLADSLTLIGPGLASRIDVSLKVKLRTALALVSNPGKLFDIPLSDARLFTDNPERIAYIENDPLSLHTCSARFLYQTRRLDRFVHRNTRKLRVPLLVMLAGRDRIIDNVTVRQLVDRFASREKKIIEYPDAAHTLEFEVDHSAIFNDMVTWLDARSRP